MSAQELHYTVVGMTCGHCTAAVQRELERVAGVESVEVDLDANSAIVRGSALDDAILRRAIEEAGYAAV